MTKLKTNKGETLIEILVSFLIFAILMMAVTAMIITSLRITGDYTAAASGQQVNANVGLLEKAELVPEDHTFTITGNGINVAVKVKISQEGNLKAFYPEVE